MKRRMYFPIVTTKHPTLFTLSALVFFFVAADGVLMYLAPILMKGSGLTQTMIGTILGLSSVFGMAFDVILSRVLKGARYRALFFVMLLLASMYPFVLFGSTTFSFYLVAMALWGLYYNLYVIGTLNYISEELPDTPHDHAHAYGVIKSFEGFGYMLAPLLASLFVVHEMPIERAPLFVFMIIIPSWILFSFLYRYPGTKRNLLRKEDVSIGAFVRVVKEIFPLLILTLLINLIDSSMWTIGPLLASTLPDGVFAGGVFMFAYTLPPLFVGYLVGEGLKRFGKKYFASVFLALGAFFSLFIGVISTPVLLVGITFIMSLAVSLAWPAVNALYADYIGTRKSVEDAVESTDDFFTNIGDVLGPMCAGALADMIGLPYAFSAIGGIVLVSLVFLYVGKYSISMLLRRNG